MNVDPERTRAMRHQPAVEIRLAGLNVVAKMDTSDAPARHVQVSQVGQFQEKGKHKKRKAKGEIKRENIRGKENGGKKRVRKGKDKNGKEKRRNKRGK